MGKLAEIKEKLWEEDEIHRMWEFRGRGSCTQRLAKEKD